MRARIDLPPGADAGSTPFAVGVMMAGSWEMYWNGTLVGRNGVPGKSPEEEQPGRIRAEVYIPPGLLKPKANVLAIRASAHHSLIELAAPIQGVSFGRLKSGMNRSPAELVGFIASGPLLLGALYFAVMFLLDPRDRDSLLLSLLALSVFGQLAAESLRLLFSYPYPVHALRLMAILGFAELSSVLLVAYVARHLAPDVARWAIAASIACLAVIAIGVRGFDGKTTLSLLSGLLIALGVALTGAVRGAEGARTIALGIAGVVVVLLVNAFIFVDFSYYVIATALLLVLFVRQAAMLRAAQLRAARLEIDLLKQKIQPHFLMNTLTALSEWIESSPATAVRMIGALAAEFRAVAAMSDAKLVPMRQELDLCRHHLAVMGYRGNREYELRDGNVDPDGLIPPAVFHTLVENSLTRNPNRAKILFELSEGIQEGRRTYILRSPFVGDIHATRGNGTGHAYVRARLRDAFGERWAFQSRAEEGQWLDIVTVPCAS